MSHYATIPMKFKFKDELVQSLVEIYGEINVEVHQTPQKMDRYRWENQQEVKAEIIIRRKTCGGYLDLGFSLDRATGMYSMIADGSMNQDVTSNIVTGYAKRVIKNRLPRGKYRITSESTNQITLQVKG